jgi:hypothetical protein
MGKDIAIGLAHYIAKLNDNGCGAFVFSLRMPTSNQKRINLKEDVFFCSKLGNALVKN